MPSFDGETFDEELDGDRLRHQLDQVKNLMKDGVWRTIPEIIDQLGLKTNAAVGSRLRDLRKEKFGSHVVERRIRGDETAGLHEYRLNLEETNANESKSPSRSEFAGFLLTLEQHGVTFVSEGDQKVLAYLKKKAGSAKAEPSAFAEFDL